MEKDPTLGTNARLVLNDAEVDRWFDICGVPRRDRQYLKLQLSSRGKIKFNSDNNLAAEFEIYSFDKLIKYYNTSK